MRWLWLFAVMTVICLAVYAYNVFTSGITPYSTLGMGYGIGAVSFMLGVLAWALRRRTMSLSSKLRLGRSRNWLYFHIYGGLLFLLLVQMHTGFRIPQGPMTFWLWVLSWWTVISGVLGLFLQKWIPKMLASGLATEVLYDRVAELVSEVRQQAETLAAGCSTAVQDYYHRGLSSLMAVPRRRLIYIFDITGGAQKHLARFEYLKRFLSAEEAQKVDNLEQLFRTKLEIEAHYTLQAILRGWLYAHVPTSLLLLVLTAIHLFSVFYY